MSSIDERLAVRASPERARSLFTVRAAISSAVSSSSPRSSALSLMCSYWRSRLALQARCGMGVLPSRGGWRACGRTGPRGPFRGPAGAGGSQWSVVGRRARDGVDEAAGLRIRQGAGDVGLADHPDELAAVEHRQAAHRMVLHRADGVLDAVVGADGDDLRAVEQVGERGGLRVE